jgi:hypothetical protein
MANEDRLDASKPTSPPGEMFALQQFHSPALQWPAGDLVSRTSRTFARHSCSGLALLQFTISRLQNTKQVRNSVASGVVEDALLWTRGGRRASLSCTDASKSITHPCSSRERYRPTLKHVKSRAGQWLIDWANEAAGNMQARLVARAAPGSKASGTLHLLSIWSRYAQPANATVREVHSDEYVDMSGCKHPSQDGNTVHSVADL